MTTTTITQTQVDGGLHFTDGNRWGLTNITFSIPGAGATWDGYAQNNLTEPTRSEYSTFSQVQADAFRAVMAVWDSYIAASITEVAEPTLGDIRVAFTDTNNGGQGSAAAYAYGPPLPDGGVHVVHGDIWVDDDYRNSDFRSGEYNRELLFHEVGHALGLKHPFEGTTLPAAYENSAYTVMSYSRTDIVYVFNATQNGYSYGGQWNVQATPMVLDIAAIQSLYGADPTTATGNTVYAYTDATIVARQSIYDAGGIDTIDLTALSRGSTVDLRPGAYSDVGYYSIDRQAEDLAVRFGAPKADFVAILTNPNFPAYTYSNNLGIAFSTVIENVRGSAKADDITGNAAANTLDGRGGEDTMRGLGGNDVYVVDEAGDQVIEAVGEGSDKVMTSASFTLAAGQEIEKLTTTNAAGTGPIDLTGNAFVQTIQGNAGANTLDGKGGADTLQGYGGNDSYLVDDTGDRVFEAANGGSDTVVTSVSYGLLAGQEVERIATADASATTAIKLTGNEFEQTLEGNEGANLLDGRGGADSLSGYGGNDTYLVDDAGDLVFEGSGAGADKVMASASFVLAAGQEIEKITTTDAAGTAAIDLTGNGFVQTIQGNAGANTLDGKGGADTLQGYGGNDIYLIDNAGDHVIEALNGGQDTIRTAISYGLAAGLEIETLSAADASGTTAIKLTGNAFAQTLEGNEGANLLDGRGGADSLSGYGGNDTYVIDDADDLVFEAVGGGADKVMASTSFLLAAGQEIEKITTTDAAGTGAIDLTGNEYAQTIQGNAGANTLDGKGGADVLQGYGGNDTYLVDDRGDILLEAVNGGTDTIRTSVSYGLVAGLEIERLSAADTSGTTAIKLTGNEFDQRLDGNAGANLLDGRDGTDILYGYGGNDTYIVGSAGDQVFEAVGGGADKVMASASFTLAEGQEIEKLTTTDAAGTNTIFLTGNAFGQTIQGNAGTNVIDGGGGADALQGYGGQDYFTFRTELGNGNVDRIIDFVHGEDVIIIESGIFGGIGAGLEEAEFKDVALGEIDDTDRILYDSRTGSLSFDADGSGATAAVTFAILTTKPTNLAASDFGLGLA